MFVLLSIKWASASAFYHTCDFETHSIPPPTVILNPTFVCELGISPVEMQDYSQFFLGSFYRAPYAANCGSLHDDHGGYHQIMSEVNTTHLIGPVSAACNSQLITLEQAAKLRGLVEYPEGVWHYWYSPPDDAHWAYAQGYVENP